MALQSKRILQRVAGFSLIELMIVVAIIGILASIAIPSYEGYVAKAKLTHLMAFSDEVRKKVTEYRTINGAFPAAADINKILNVPKDEYINGTTASDTAATGVGLVVKVSGASAKYTIVGKKSGFPGGGDPVIQLTAAYSAATASTSAMLSWTCAGWTADGPSANPPTAPALSSAVDPGASNYFSEACPVAGAAITW